MPKLGEVQPKAHARRGQTVNESRSCNGSQQESNPDPSSTATTASPPTATRHQVGTTIPAVRRCHGRLRRASLARRTGLVVSVPLSVSLYGSRVTGQHVRAGMNYLLLIDLV